MYREEFNSVLCRVHHQAVDVEKPKLFLALCPLDSTICFDQQTLNKILKDFKLMMSVVIWLPILILGPRGAG